MQANVGKLGKERNLLGGKQARLAKMEGSQLKGDFEQRRSGRGNAENKEACFECGNTDHFKAQLPIWIEKKERRGKEGKPQNG